jgi:hypothetical protein
LQAHRPVIGIGGDVEVLVGEGQDLIAVGHLPIPYGRFGV